MISPTTIKEDITISIHLQHIRNIVNRTKNHEFRKYLIPPSVKRLWIYETSPASSIKYIATISHGKRPGEICDPTGLRNDEFDSGKLDALAKYGYEILKLEELPRSYSLAELKKEGWLNGPPQKYCFVTTPMRKAFESIVLRVVFEASAKVVPSIKSQLPLELRTRPATGAFRRIQHSGAIQKPQRGSASVQTDIRRLSK